MIAYVFASGRIYFGQTLPRKAIPLMQGRAKSVREFVAATTTCSKYAPAYFLHRLTAAQDGAEAWAALVDYIEYIKPKAPACIEVNTAILAPAPWSLKARSAFVRPIKDVLRDCEGANHG